MGKTRTKPKTVAQAKSALKRELLRLAKSMDRASCKAMQACLELSGKSEDRAMIRSLHAITLGIRRTFELL